ncbi:signal peptide peptidase SppA [Lyngbya confervoides]|uniref:Signal peptide peptidase SppA n=1 Tax=Lyngbya confervoides BDU141951 TaxID=1574623 RepID=A0ABD4SYD9_9CYAN|nr:signal peptide peptidase SppA [Lyngbya confervoides]MCM1981395.1 signal peptide peptidase SppA [Lyngbya confervoides BDU141951]
MRRPDRIFALVLIVLCLVASLGNWLSTLIPRRPLTSAPASGPEIALIKISGPIAEGAEGGIFQSGDTGSTRIVKAIRQARQDKAKAILLQINSPGGTASASLAIHRELMRTRQTSQTKVVALLGDVAASGGYYVATAAEHIVANPDTLTGSIGVIIRTQNVASLLDKVGIESGNFKSGEFKDILSPYRPSTPAEKQILQTLVDESYQQFLEAIATGREMPLDKIKPYADGRIFSGSQALAANLVDSLGNYYDAIDVVRELAGIKAENPKVDLYPPNRFPGRLGDLFTSTVESLVPGYQQVQFAAKSRGLPLMLWDY